MYIGNKYSNVYGRYTSRYHKRTTLPRNFGETEIVYDMRYSHLPYYIR